MKKRIRHIILLLFTAFSILKTNAQQDAIYSQYMFNPVAINPAFTGMMNHWSLSALGRFQWVGIDGAPMTQTFSAHTPIEGYNSSAGAFIAHDQIGATNTYLVNGLYSYRIHFRETTISMGLSVGFNQFRSDLNSLDIRTQNDKAFADDRVSAFLPNVGVGFMYYNHDFYVGFSVPRMLNSPLQAQLTDIENRLYMLTGGYVFDINESFALKPNILLRTVEAGPSQIDINLNAEYMQKLWAGLSYRSMSSIMILLQGQLTNEIRIGYAFDYLTNNLNNYANLGSHEIMINYTFLQKENGPVRYLDSPRHF